VGGKVGKDQQANFRCCAASALKAGAVPCMEVGVFFTTLQAMHGRKVIFLGMVRKRGIPIISCLRYVQPSKND
jgi:hypothetical protein